MAAVLVSLIVISARNKAELPNAPFDPDAPLDPSITLPAVTPNVDVLTESYDMAFIGPPAPITEPDSVTVKKNNDEVHTGNLILVNRDHPYNFDFEQPQTTLYSNKNRVYQLSAISLSLNSDLVPVFDALLEDFAQATGCKKVLVTSGFRSYQVQKDLYDSRVKSQGQEMADLYVACQATASITPVWPSIWSSSPTEDSIISRSMRTPPG
jgi:hypothetical protein